MFVTSLGRSVLGKTVPSVLSTAIYIYIYIYIYVGLYRDDNIYIYQKLAELL